MDILEILSLNVSLKHVSTTLDHKFVHSKYFVTIIIFLASPLPESGPCDPSPCGSNAICKELNRVGSCICLPDYIGNPYEGCRPECILNSDCPANKACINTKCTDPCPGTCGLNAECQVINHLPICNCYPRHTGNPFTSCKPIKMGM